MTDPGRPRKIPERGDVPPGTVAQRLGVSLVDFQQMLPLLDRRGFPTADPTTGNYCIEAVDKWRINRFPKLFGGTEGAMAVNAGEVFDERRQRVFGKR